MKYIAVRDINAGDQIFLSYCNSGLPAEERRKLLETYGFLCQCAACVNATPESDKLRGGIRRKGCRTRSRKTSDVGGSEIQRSFVGSLAQAGERRCEGGPGRFPYLLRIILDGYVQLKNQKKTEEYRCIVICSSTSCSIHVISGFNLRPNVYSGGRPCRVPAHQ